MNSLLPIIGLWGNKILLPSMKLKSCKSLDTNSAQKGAYGPVGKVHCVWGQRPAARSLALPCPLRLRCSASHLTRRLTRFITNSAAEGRGRERETMISSSPLPSLSPLRRIIIATCYGLPNLQSPSLPTATARAEDGERERERKRPSEGSVPRGEARCCETRTLMGIFR